MILDIIIIIDYDYFDHPLTLPLQSWLWPTFEKNTLPKKKLKS